MCADVCVGVGFRVWLRVVYRIGFRYLRVSNAVCVQDFVFSGGFRVWLRVGFRVGFRYLRVGDAVCVQKLCLVSD